MAESTPAAPNRDEIGGGERNGEPSGSRINISEPAAERVTSIPAPQHMTSLPPAATVAAEPRSSLDGHETIPPSQEAGPSSKPLQPLDPSPPPPAPLDSTPRPPHSSSNAIDLAAASAATQEAKPELNEEHARLLASLAAGHGIDLTSSAFTAGMDEASHGDFSNLSGALIQQAAHQMKTEDAYDDGEGFDQDEHMATPEPEDEGPQGPIQAYAKIDFPGFSIYIQTLEVTIGRRPAHHKLAPSLRYTHAIDGKSRLEGDVDIDLGDVKSISRRHAVIYYHAGPFYPQPYPNGGPPDTSILRGFGSYGPCWRESHQQLKDLFVIKILGKHGAMVDDVYIRQGGIVQLGKRTKIQIAERVFYFVLPPSVAGLSTGSHIKELDSLSPSEDESDDDEAMSADNQSEDEAHHSSSELSEVESGDGSAKEDGEGATASKAGEPKRRTKLVIKRKGLDKGKVSVQGDSVGDDDSDSEDDVTITESKSTKKAKTKDSKGKSMPSWAQGAGVASRKRKRGDPTSDEEALRVGTPIGIETLDAEKRAKAAKKRLAKASEVKESARGDASHDNEASRLEDPIKDEESQQISATKAGKSTANGKGKGKGKGAGKGYATKAVPEILPKSVSVQEGESAPSNTEATEEVAAPVSDNATSGASNAANIAAPVATAEASVTSSIPTPSPAIPSTGQSDAQHPVPPSMNALAPASVSSATPTAVGPRFAPAPGPATGTFVPFGPPPIGSTPAVSHLANYPIPGAPYQSTAPGSSSVQPNVPPPPPPPPEKPNMSNVELVKAALRSPMCTSGSGKLTLVEIFDWVQKEWSWFRENGRQNGQDWQSALKQAISSSKEFFKIRRKPTDKQSKGVFFALTDSPVAQQEREELARLRADAKARALASLEARAAAEARGEFQPGTLITQRPSNGDTPPSIVSPTPLVSAPPATAQASSPPALQAQSQPQGVPQPQPQGQFQAQMQPRPQQMPPQPQPQATSPATPQSQPHMPQMPTHPQHTPQNQPRDPVQARPQPPRPMPAVTPPGAALSTPSGTSGPPTRPPPQFQHPPIRPNTPRPTNVAPRPPPPISLPRPPTPSAAMPPLPKAPRLSEAPVQTSLPSATTRPPAMATAVSRPPQSSAVGINAVPRTAASPPVPTPRPQPVPPRPPAHSPPPASTAASPTPTPSKAGSPSTPRGTPKPQQAVPLVVGPPPPGAVVPKKANPAVQALLDAPPIVHHDGKLFLSATVFGHLSQRELTDIERLGPQKALKSLQDLLVEHLKQKMRQQQLAGQKGKASPSPSPAPSAPSPRPRPVNNASASPAPQRPPIGSPAASSSSARPPAPVGPPRPGPIRPPASASIRPVQTGGSQPQPQMAGQGRPPPLSTPRLAPAQNAIRPPIPPAGSAGVIRPPHGAGSSPAPRPHQGPLQQSSSGQQIRPPVNATVRPQRPLVAPNSVRPAGSPAHSPPPVPRPVVMGQGSSPPPPGSPLAALNSLSAHPEAAGLMAVLRQNGGEPGKLPQLTPGQIQLLQLANAIASQHQQQAKAAAAAAAAGNVRPRPSPSPSPAPSPRPPTAPVRSEAPISSSGSSLPQQAPGASGNQGRINPPATAQAWPRPPVTTPTSTTSNALLQTSVGLQPKASTPILLSPSPPPSATAKLTHVPSAPSTIQAAAPSPRKETTGSTAATSASVDQRASQASTALVPPIGSTPPTFIEPGSVSTSLDASASSTADAPILSSSQSVAPQAVSATSANVTPGASSHLPPTGSELSQAEPPQDGTSNGNEPSSGVIESVKRDSPASDSNVKAPSLPPTSSRADASGKEAVEKGASPNVSHIVALDTEQAASVSSAVPASSSSSSSSPPHAA